jgi:undecaprenyl pyrophosphate phosphatase UppP
MSHLTYAQAIVTGIVQGVTELFPISSLGHNVLIPAVVGGSWGKDLSVSAPNSPYLAFIVGLHVATALAMIIYFWRDWVRIVGGFFSSLRHRQIATADQRLAWMIILATIPVGIAGAALQKVFTDVFAKGSLTAIFLAINGCILLYSERQRRLRMEVAAAGIDAAGAAADWEASGRSVDGGRGGRGGDGRRGGERRAPGNDRGGYGPEPGDYGPERGGYGQGRDAGYPAGQGGPGGYDNGRGGYQQGQGGYEGYQQGQGGYEPGPGDRGGYPPDQPWQQQPGQQQWQGPDPRYGDDPQYGDDPRRGDPRYSRDEPSPQGPRFTPTPQPGRDQQPGQDPRYQGGDDRYSRDEPATPQGPRFTPTPQPGQDPQQYDQSQQYDRTQQFAQDPQFGQGGQFGQEPRGGQDQWGAPAGQAPRDPRGGQGPRRDERQWRDSRRPQPEGRADDSRRRQDDEGGDAVAADRRLAGISYKRAVLIGSAQILALLPGISRDGIVTVTGMNRGLRREDAVRFSFLLSAPVILAAGALKVHDLFGPEGNGIHGPVLVGSLLSFIGAYLSVRFLTRYFSESRSLRPFGIYCIVAGVLAFAYLLVK